MRLNGFKKMERLSKGLPVTSGVSWVYEKYSGFYKLYSTEDFLLGKKPWQSDTFSWRGTSDGHAYWERFVGTRIDSMTQEERNERLPKIFNALVDCGKSEEYVRETYGHLLDEVV